MSKAWRIAEERVRERRQDRQRWYFLAAMVAVMLLIIFLTPKSEIQGKIDSVTIVPYVCPAGCMCSDNEVTCTTHDYGKPKPEPPTDKNWRGN